MLVLRHRLAVAGIITAAAVAVPAAALASGLGSPSGQPSPSQAAAAAASKSALAASESGSQSGKPAPPQGSVRGGDKSGAADQPQPTGLPAAASALATRLNVNISAAQRAVKQIVGLIINNGSADPASSAFAAIAQDLGVSPAQLAAAWDAVKQNVTGL